MNILFICSGNVARSQMAEAYYNHFTNSHRASSAGLSSQTPEKYIYPVREVITVMQEDGIDVSDQRVKTVTEQMVNTADLLVVMSKGIECPSFILKHRSVAYWDIDDPFQTPIETFRRVRDEIKKSVVDLVQSCSK